MPPAARTTDVTSHGPPLTPGPGSPTVLIGMLPAWRAVPASVGAAIESVGKATNSFMTTPVLTPASAASKLAKMQSGLVESAAKAAGEGNPAGIAASTTALVALNATNVALTATWTAASAVPGGQPAANVAYTEGIKAALAAAATAVFAAVAGVADTHVCPIPVPVPPHGPGMVVKGSSTVVINNLPACRQGDKVVEAVGGPDPIAMGCPTVLIGDSGGGGGGGGGGSGGQSGGAAGVAGGVTALRALGGSAGGAAITPVSIEAMVVSCECSNPNCAEAFESAAESGTPLVDRESHGCGGAEVQEVDTGTHWIEIELVDENEKPVPNEPYRIILPDEKTIEGTLGPDGKARVEGITDPGNCRIEFTNLDKNAVDDA